MLNFGISRAPTIVLLLSLLCLTGCRDNKPRHEVVDIDGARIEKIDLKNNRITVRFTPQREGGTEQVGTASVTDETEIVINGVLSSLADLREGDYGHGQVKVEKTQDTRTLTALRIVVFRAESDKPRHDNHGSEPGTPEAPPEQP